MKWNDSERGFEIPQPIDINSIKEKAEDINKPSDAPKSDIDGMLNLTAGPITPAEKIVKETTTEEQKKSDDYFKTPDLSAIQIPAAFEQSNVNDESVQDDNSIEIDNKEDNMNQNASIVTEENPEKYTVDAATDKIRNLIEDLKKHGIDINADEMNFPTSYQVIIKIQKVD